MALRRVDRVTTRATVLGTALATPIMIAPISYHRLIHPDGEAATARGGAAAGSLLVVSTRATVSLEEIADAAPELPRWLQVYILKDRGWTAELVARAASAGCRALVLTVDAPVVGRNLRARRSNFSFPQSQLDPAIGFEDIGWLREQVYLPVVVKGVLRGDDAAACVDAGADAVAVSNHGGRQLDMSVATADALAEVTDRVGGWAEVYADGGIRRGTDVLKALALGATAVMVGRPVIWGLATAGSEGVHGVLAALNDELIRGMMLCQTATLGDISPDLVAPNDSANARPHGRSPQRR